MFPTKSGKSYGSAYVAKKKDAMHAGSESPVSSKMSPLAPSPKADAAEPRTNSMGEAKFSAANANAPDNNVLGSPDNFDAGAVAAEHGPASTVTVHHDHAAKKHHVVSRHPDGHMHTSDHASAADAHDHAAQLGGEANTENNDKAPNEDQSGDSAMFGNDGFKTPHLA